MSTQNETQKQNQTLEKKDKFVNLKDRQIQEIKDGLSDEARTKLSKLAKKSHNSQTTDTETKSVSNDSVEVTVISKNPKYDDFVTQLKPYVDDSKSVMKEIYSKSVRLVYNYIQMGKILTKSKETLSKDDYESLLKHFDIEERTAYRYIKLVKNDNVSKLSIDNMKSMINPSIGKLTKMHSLSDDEFETVLCGNDEPLQVTSNSGDTENVYPLSSQIDNTTYDELKKKTKVDIMKYFLDDIDDLKNQIDTANKDNKALFELIAVNNISLDDSKVS
jgi:hypothetical protein